MVPRLKTQNYIMTLQLLVKPAMNALYRVIYVENRLINRKNNNSDIDELDSYECYATNFKTAFGIEENKAEGHEYDDQDSCKVIMLETVENEPENLNSFTINEALELKLKHLARNVINY